MPEIRLTEEELRYASLFESITGIVPLDTIIDPQYNRIIYVVDKNFAPLAVGKGGINAKRLKDLIGKDVEIVEKGDSPEEVIRNALYPAKVIAVKITKASQGRLIAIATVNPRDKAVAIGKNGRNINRARLLAKRYFDVDKVIIA